VDTARDLLAALLTQANGEYVVRVGNQPPRTEVLSGDVTDETPSWTGIARSADEVTTLCSRLTNTVEEIGGKVSSSGPQSRYYGVQSIN
jgi:hypothetical protein